MAQAKLEAPYFPRPRRVRVPAEPNPWRSHDIVANGYVPLARSMVGMSVLYVDVIQKLRAKIAAALTISRINHSAYQPLQHLRGGWPLYTKWYPIALNANTRLDVRYRVMAPGGVPGGYPSKPAGPQMRAMQRYTRAWKIPRYPTAPAQVTPTPSP